MTFSFYPAVDCDLGARCRPSAAAALGVPPSEIFETKYTCGTIINFPVLRFPDSGKLVPVRYEDATGFSGDPHKINAWNYGVLCFMEGEVALNDRLEQDMNP